jgi:hypothetical protein
LPTITQKLALMQKHLLYAFLRKSDRKIFRQTNFCFNAAKGIKPVVKLQAIITSQIRTLAIGKWKYNQKMRQKELRFAVKKIHPPFGFNNNSLAKNMQPVVKTMAYGPLL